MVRRLCSSLPRASAPRAPVVAALVALGAACSGAPKDDGDPSADSGGADTGVDTGDTQDSGDTGDSEDSGDTQDSGDTGPPPTRVSVAVSPSALAFPTTRGEQFLTAVATLSDGGTVEVTTECAWQVADTAVATVWEGVLHPLGVGATTVSCDLPDGLVGTAPVSVDAVAPATNGEVVFNEVLADVPTAADPNADGAPDASEDEFVELVNVGRYTLDVGGYALWDGSNATPRHVFPTPTVLRPGEAVVVFGGGAPAVSATNCTAVPVANDDAGLQLGLALNNDGDSLALRDTLGGDITAMTYDGAVEDASVVLRPELDGTSYTHHLYVTDSVGPYSPCTLADGAPFPAPTARW
jgi:hypothetical protein